MNKKWKIQPIILIALIAMFLIGYILGILVQQSLFIKGAVEIAEGLEGTEFNIEIDINETIMVDRMFELFNGTQIVEGLKEESLKNCTKDYTGRSC